MSIESAIPKWYRDNYRIIEWRHAASILKLDFEEELSEILGMLKNFKLNKSDILTAGGGKSPIASKLDSFLISKGWVEKHFDTKQLIDGREIPSPTHKVDCYKNRIALEVEWNNKDPFFDRDLNNFRLLFELKVISVGVIITRSSSLQVIFDQLGKGASYGASTTHLNKLIPKIEGGGGGGCPILVIAITDSLYADE